MKKVISVLLLVFISFGLAQDIPVSSFVGDVVASLSVAEVECPDVAMLEYNLGVHPGYLVSVSCFDGFGVEDHSTVVEVALNHNLKPVSLLYLNTMLCEDRPSPCWFKFTPTTSANHSYITGFRFPPTTEQTVNLIEPINIEGYPELIIVVYSDWWQ